MSPFRAIKEGCYVCYSFLHLTICTMKIIIFFMLAGVSLAQDDSVVECFNAAAKEAPDFITNLRTLMCDYNGGTITDPQNDENYNKALKNVIDAMGKTGCAADIIFGTKSYQAALEKAATDAKAFGRDFVAKNMDAIQVSGLVMGTGCTVLNAPGGVASG